MYTSIALLALTTVNATTTENPAWLKTDYATAQRLGAQDRKPLVVLLSPGKTGWRQVLNDGEPGAAVEKMLQDRYVCVHVDTTTTAGKDLARQIKVPEGLGLVISDRSGEYQAFRHEGKMSNDDLGGYLRRYSDPDRIVTRTDMGRTTRNSFTIAPESSNPPSSPTYPNFQSFQNCPTCSSGSCSSCGGGRRR